MIEAEYFACQKKIALYTRKGMSNNLYSCFISRNRPPVLTQISLRYFSNVSNLKQDCLTAWIQNRSASQSGVQHIF